MKLYHYRLWKEGMTEDDWVWLTSETDPPSRLPEGFTHYTLLGASYRPAEPLTATPPLSTDQPRQQG